jgi:hypothetical protein
VADFAVPTDVETAYEGSLPGGVDSPRIQYLIDVVSARLRLLMPTLEARIVAADALAVPPATESDLAIMTRDVVVQAVIRKLPGNAQQTSSETQTAGPWSVTKRYTTDSSQTFPDDDLSLLGYLPVGSGEVGSIRTGRPDWSMQ